MIEIHDKTNKDLNLFNLNKKFKKTAEAKNNKTNQSCYLLNVQTTVVSTKILIKNKKFSNMKNEATLMKLKKRFFSRKNNKDLKVIFEYSYSSYVNEVVSTAIQIAQQVIAVTETFNSKSKKKNNESTKIIIAQLNREVNVRKSIRNNFDQRLNSLIKLY